MPKVVEYFLSPVSPWTYLGHARLVEIATQHGATIDPIPIDLMELFPLTGGLPLAKRAPERQAYRMLELKRWRRALDVPLTLEPRFFPADSKPAVAFLTAAKLRGDDAVALAGKILAACWAEERNIADPSTLIACAGSLGLDGAAIQAAAQTEETTAEIANGFARAQSRGLFGAPGYVVDGELFWGQDRLEFVERALLM